MGRLFIWRALPKAAGWRWLMLLLLLFAGGCASLGYYGQSIGGQWAVWERRQPIAELIATPETSAALREKLQTVLAIREFASHELGLPDNASYRSYADLQRPYVVWNVFAAQPLEMTLQRWCFPFAGCVGYRGYFSKAAAEAFASQLGREGLETYVAGVAAYSTLGWFDDPLLNTVIQRPPARIAGLIFHELAHQQLYLQGDTAFNEGFATAVELEGVRRWLAAHGDDAQREADQQFRQRQDAFVALVTGARDRLRGLYAQRLDEAEALARKAAIQAGLRRDYRRLREEWGGYDGYDAWFAQGLNNAQLAAVTTYRDHVPAFQRLLAEQGGDMAAFYRACRELSERPTGERGSLLAGR